MGYFEHLIDEIDSFSFSGRGFSYIAEQAGCRKVQ